MMNLKAAGKIRLILKIYTTRKQNVPLRKQRCVCCNVFLKGERHNSFLLSQLDFLSQVALFQLKLVMSKGLQQVVEACCSLPPTASSQYHRQVMLK